MKKISSIGFALVYVFLVGGSTLYFHYCGGRFTSVNIPFIHLGTCSCGKNRMKKGCCRNQSIHLSINGEQKSESAIVTEVGSVQIFDRPFITRYEYSSLQLRNCPVAYEHSPPSPRSDNSLIWNSVFRI